MARIHLVDASPYVFRAYFSIPATMTSPDGRPVNAVQGFTSFLLELVRGENVTHAAVAFDESLTTSFRNEVFPAYKAQRELPPKELEAQLKDCQDACRALGLAAFVSERYEADDLIATLCRPLERAGHDVVVVSPDKDLSQLVSDRVTILDWARESRRGPAEVREKFGVDAVLVPDWLALVGDTSDNIPGVPGVGPKAAAALLAGLGPIESIFDRLDEVAALDVRGAKSLRAKLEGRREQALLSKWLATVALDAPAQASLEDLEWKGAHRPLVDVFAERLGFGRLAGRIPRWRDA